MRSAFSELVASTLLVVGALFPIVNPLGNAPIFLMLTRGVSDQGRAKLARTIAVNGLALIVVSIFIGTHVCQQILEAAALGLKQLRQIEMIEDDGAVELTVELVTRTVHQVPLSKLRAWLDSSGRDPREAAMKAKLK